MPVTILPMPRPPSAYESFFGANGSPEEMRRQYLMNQALVLNNQYAPQMNDARLALLNAQGEGQNLYNKYYPQAQSDAHNNALAMWALRNAQAKREAAIAAQPGHGIPLTGAAGKAWSVEALRRTLGDDNPVVKDAVNAFKVDIGRQTALTNYLNSNAQFKNLPNEVKAGMIAQGAKISQPDGTFQEPSPEVKETAKGVVALKTTFSNQQNRIQAGAAFNTSAKTALYWFDNGASKYFGPKGQLALKVDQARSIATGITPPGLVAYRSFQNAIENMNLQGAKLEGVPADQISRSDYKKVFDLNEFLNSPAAARQQLSNSINLVKSAEAVNRAPFHKLIDPAQSEKIAKEATILPKADSSKTAGKEIQIPTFETEAQADKWFAGLSSQQQKQVIAQILGDA